MPEGKGAVVVVACVAGFGAWGTASVSVAPNPTYASELFGSGHAAIKYPAKMTPVVTLAIPRNLDARAAAGANTPDDATDDVVACPARSHNGSVEVTFTLLAGVFDGNVTGLMWDTVAGNTVDPVAAPASVASIVSGGRKNDNWITIKVEEATNGGAPADGDAASRSAARSSVSVAYQSGGANNAACNEPDTFPDQVISFNMPSISGLSDALKDASKTKDMVRQVSLQAESRIVSGAFTDGYLTGNLLNGFTTAVVKSRDAVTLSITDPNKRDIVIKGDSSFKAVKQAVKGYVELATVTVSTRTKHVHKAKSATGSKTEYRIGSYTAATKTHSPATSDSYIYTAATKQAEVADTLYGLDGEMVDAGLRGVLTMSAMGTRDLFNEDDKLFIDYDGNKTMGGSEEIVLDGDMGMGTALSIDSDVYKGGVGNFKVYYMAGGKVAINHGAMIKLTANVDYSDPSATDEAAKNTSTTFNFEGVTSEVMAYAIPHSTNGTGDKANVRVRCEASAGCRVFVECWDDAGMRAFGEAGEIAGNALAKWDAAAIEGVIGVTDPASRHSCRILSAGMVSVQQLTRDGNSKTLVNNTYVGQ